jgi:hypothetical protein
MLRVMIAALSTTSAVLLAAAIGVIGAVLGATSSGVATYVIDDRRQKFERRQALRAELRQREGELAVARGIARVWADQLGTYRAPFSPSSASASPKSGSGGPTIFMNGLFPKSQPRIENKLLVSCRRPTGRKAHLSSRRR